MQAIEQEEIYYEKIDIVKCICAALIVVSHCLPIFDGSAFDILYGQWFFRFSVPFYFLSVGFFINSNYLKSALRILKLYIVCTTIYSPIILLGTSSAYGLIYNLIFGWYHLWFLSATFMAILMIYILIKYCKFSLDKLFLSAVILFFLGVFLGSYITLLDPALYNVISKALELIGGTRHGVFFGFPLIVFGMFIRMRKNLLSTLNNLQISIVFLCLTVLSFVEAVCLLKANPSIKLDITLFMPCVAIALLLMCINKTFNNRKCAGGAIT